MYKYISKEIYSNTLIYVGMGDGKPEIHRDVSRLDILMDVDAAVLSPKAVYSTIPFLGTSVLSL
jgi:hypothetical protein